MSFLYPYPCYRYCECDGFCQWCGEPDAFGSNEHGEEVETGEEEQESAHEHDDGGGFHSLYALVVAGNADVEDEEDEP